MTLYGGQAPVLPTGSIIVVTGANGFVGSHVCDQLLGLGYRVRGTVRDRVRCQWVISLFDVKYPGLFEAFEIPNLSQPGALDEALRHAAGVAHIATEAMQSSDPNVAVAAAVNPTLEIFHSALKATSIKRFVLTSSSSALYTPSPNSKKAKMITAHDWNIEAVARAWAPPPYTVDRTLDVYAACKTQSESALRKALRESETDLVVNTIAPDSNFGPSLNNNFRSSTCKLLYEAWKQGSGAGLAVFFKGGYRWFIDVRDTARLHVAGLLDPDVKNERLIGYAHKWDGHELVGFFRQYAEDQGMDRRFEPASSDDWSCIDLVDTRRSEEVLRRLGREGWTARNETLSENLRD